MEDATHPPSSELPSSPRTKTTRSYIIAAEHHQGHLISIRLPVGKNYTTSHWLREEQNAARQE